MANEPPPGQVAAGRLYGPGAAAFRHADADAAAAGDPVQPEAAAQPKMSLDEALDARAACSSVHQALLEDSLAAEHRLQQAWPHVEPGLTASLGEILDDLQRSEQSAHDKKLRRQAYERTRKYEDVLEACWSQ